MILISLVGEQPIPNLMPLWQFAQIDRTQFAATDATMPHAETTALAIRGDPALSHVDVLPALKVDAYDIQKSRLVLSQTVSQYLNEGAEVWLNLTAGTKIMSLAGLQAAYGTGITLVYTSSETGEYIFLRSDGTESHRIRIDVQISVKQYLQAFGFEVGENQAFRPDIYASPPPPKEGDALEIQVEQLARQSGLFDDVMRNVFIRKQAVRDDVHNELDIAITRNGRLAVCSCKATSNFEKETLYELSSLMRREYGGIYCGKVIATTAEVSDAMLDRARLWGMHLVGGSQLKNINLYLKQATE